MAPKHTARTGFTRKDKKAKNNMQIEDIMCAGTEPLLTSLVYHTALLGAFFGQSTNRSRSAVKWTVKLDEESIGDWANSPEEALAVLADCLDTVVEECVARGFLTAPVKP